LRKNRENRQPLFQGEGKRAWRARVRVIVSRARWAHGRVRNPACGVRCAAGEPISSHLLYDPHRLALRARPPLPVLVLDDNWPSRRTAESLGARVTGNFVTYRRDM